MELSNRLKNGLVMFVSAVLAVVMFPVLLLTTTFFLMTSVVVAGVGAYRFRHLLRHSRDAAVNRDHAKGATIEGSFSVIHPGK